MSFMDDVASLWGGGSAKKAAKDQAKAIREQTAADTKQNAYAAQAAADQMRNVQMTMAATTYAEELLGKPSETVSVRLAPDEQVASTDLRTRKRGIRDTYRTATDSQWLR